MKLDDYRMRVGLEGEVSWERNHSKLQQALNAVIGQYADVLLDISQLAAIDPICTELLVRSCAEGKFSGTTFYLTGVEKTGINLMLLVRLITAFEHSFNHPKAA